MQQKFLLPSFYGQILVCTTLLHFVHHVLYNLRICSYQCRQRRKVLLHFFAMKYFCLRIIFFCLLIDSNLYIRNNKCKTNVSSADDKEGMYYENN